MLIGERCVVVVRAGQRRSCHSSSRSGGSREIEQGIGLDVAHPQRHDLKVLKMLLSVVRGWVMMSHERWRSSSGGSRFIGWLRKGTAGDAKCRTAMAYQ